MYPGLEWATTGCCAGPVSAFFLVLSRIHFRISSKSAAQDSP
jgi:hypothetical protein